MYVKLNSCLNSQTLPLTVRKTQLYTQTPFPGSTHQLCRNSSTPFIEFSSTRTCEIHSDQHIPLDPPFVNLSQDMIRHCKPLPDFTCTINLSFLLMQNNLSQHATQSRGFRPYFPATQEIKSSMSNRY